jgi:hypothetical protein
MRRREKFVISSVLLTLCLLGVQYVSLDFRYMVIAVFIAFTYLVSTWALSDDLQLHERLTVVPFPALYAASVSLFYFLLPENFLSQLFILILFGVGMYGLFLTSNIYSVAKGRSIQLLHAAHAIGFIFGVLVSLLLSNTIFSLKLPFYMNALLIGLVHFPLILMQLWSVKLEAKISAELINFSLIFNLILVELALILSFFPLTVWYSSLFIMSFFYIGGGLMHSFMRGRLFLRTFIEYSLVAAFVGLMFLAVFPVK